MCKVNMIIRGGNFNRQVTPQFSQSVEHRSRKNIRSPVLLCCSIIPSNEVSRSGSYRCSLQCALHTLSPVAYPGILFRVGGSINSVEGREWGCGGGSSLVRDSGGSCNLVQETSFHIVKFFKYLVL